MTRKKKIGIVTITNDGYNFGNRLQNYALQTVLERMGYNVQTLNRPIRENQRIWWRKWKKVLHYFIPFRQQIEHIKAGDFFFWNLRHIHWAKPVATDKNLPKLAKQFDYFVAGSDQIWNPGFLWGSDPYFFLQFARPEQRIAYAPSIGIDTAFQEPYKTQFKEMLQNWRALSCRENAGAKIMSGQLGKDIPCLLDPTLLLSRENWAEMTRSRRTPQKYILLYALGNLTGEYKKYVEELSGRIGCEIVDVMNDKRYAGCSPSRFVSLIQHSGWVVSDSYHACVFATIFHRPFTFIDRVGCGMDMNSRMETLVDKLNIGISELESVTEIMPADWMKVDEAIAKERQVAIEYLEESLK